MMIKHTLTIMEFHYIDRGFSDCVDGVQQKRNPINHGGRTALLTLWGNDDNYPP